MVSPKSAVSDISPSTGNEIDVQKLRFSTSRSHDQSQCPLFSLPPELRNMIFHFALMDYEDTSKPYQLDTPYGRPGNRAPRKTDTALLRTCQRAYQETWFRPWASALHILWFASPQRRPSSVTTIEKLHRTISQIKAAGIETEVDHIRIYAQLYMLETGDNLNSLFSSPDFRPRCVTICLRHTDWWNWESDQAMYIKSMFVNICRFPNSVREVRMELETIERRKGQLVSITEQMRNSWFFTRKDGTRLSARDTPVQEMAWEGLATWEGNRWVRDEIGPNRLRYFVQTISWIKSDNSTDPLPECPNIYAQNPPVRIVNGESSINYRILAAASIEETDDAETALEKLSVFNAAERERATALRQERRERAQRFRARLIRQRASDESQDQNNAQT